MHEVLFDCADQIQKTKYKPLNKTSRERPKSAPYLRLKNSKRTSKCQVLSSTVPKKNFQKFFDFFLNFLVSRIVPKNVKGALWLSTFFNIGFSTSILLQNRKKMKGEPFGDIKKIAKKSLIKPKKIYTKNWTRSGLEPMSFRLADLKKP